ncbi:hypothetical protein [Arthrobacter sp. 2MCAF14]|uniref:hypothetical protein n=1 Tax=Arthrobacter sp. 2MCAF14 TaxID=3232982 RepID=UPI003F9176A7
MDALVVEPVDIMDVDLLDNVVVPDAEVRKADPDSTSLGRGGAGVAHIEVVQFDVFGVGDQDGVAGSRSVDPWFGSAAVAAHGDVGAVDVQRADAGAAPEQADRGPGGEVLRAHPRQAAPGVSGICARSGIVSLSAVHVVCGVSL